MSYKDVRENKDKGFSLVELIVVIAIMAVMVAVLAPALLSYVERSRAQKDDSAMGEVANAVMLAMADQNVYDEVLYYTAYGNVSCYIHSAAETADDVKDHVVKTKDASGNWKEQYTFGDNARLTDETIYHAAGNMRGVTITFQPEISSNKSKYVLANGIVNKFIQEAPKTTGLNANTNKVATGRKADQVTYVNANPTYGIAEGKTGTARGTLGAMATSSNSNTYLYNKVRSIIGDTVELTSQTYRNSEYTVFIRMGSTGGNQASAQDAIKVYGQWNGTNLPNTSAGTIQPTTPPAED